MKDENKTKAQLIEELRALRRRIAETSLGHEDEGTCRGREERYRKLCESIPLGIIETGADARISYANAEAALMLGSKAPQEIIGKHAAEVYFDAQQRTRLFKELLEKGAVKDYQVTLKRKDGTLVEVMGAARVDLDSRGNILRTQGIFADISQRKQRERILEQQKSELQSRSSILATGLKDLELDELLDLALKELMRFAGVESGGIHLIEGDRLVLRAWSGISSRLHAHLLSLPLADPPQWSTGKPTLCTEPQGSLPGFAQEEGFRLLVGVPLQVAHAPENTKKEWLGSIFLAGRNHEDFREERLGSLESLAACLSTAIVHWRTRNEAERRLDRLAALHEIDRAIIQRRDLKEILHVALERVPVELGADAAAISLINGNQGRPKVFAMRLPSGEVIEEEAFTLA